MKQTPPHVMKNSVVDTADAGCVLKLSYMNVLNERRPEHVEQLTYFAAQCRYSTAPLERAGNAARSTTFLANFFCVTRAGGSAAQ